MIETKDKILDTAERLFATQGIEATSLRQITSEAAVNLAAVNYHFLSKDELVKSVYLRRIRPMNEARLARLNEAKTGDLSSLLDAFLEPVVDMALNMDGGQFTIAQFIGRLYTEPHNSAQSILMNEMKETALRFVSALSLCLPHLSPTELFWRMHFVIGMLAHSLAAGEKIRLMSSGKVDPQNRTQMLSQMKAFATAGLLAPSLERTP